MSNYLIADSEITVSELNADDVSMIDQKTLAGINKILENWKEWNKPTFQLMIENQKIIIRLLTLSTGLKKKAIKRLKAKEFDLLVLMFLSVNSEFFIQRMRLIQVTNNGE